MSRTIDAKHVEALLELQDSWPDLDRSFDQYKRVVFRQAEGGIYCAEAHDISCSGYQCAKGFGSTTDAAFRNLLVDVQRILALNIQHQHEKQQPAAELAREFSNRIARLQNALEKPEPEQENS